VFGLWLLHYLDDDPDTRKPGSIGVLLVLFLATALLSGVGALTSADNDRYAVIYFLKTYAGYLSFFPALLLIRKDRRNAMVICVVIVLAAAVLGLITAYNGIVGAGERTYMRETGIRVFSRQVWIVSIGFLFVFFNLYAKGRSRLPLPLAGAILFMTGVGILLSQTRGVWLGVLGSVVAGILISSIKREQGRSRIRGILRPLLTFATIALVAVMAVGNLSLLSTEGIAERAGSIGEESLEDVSFLTRLVLWNNAVREISSGGDLLLGKGLGYEFTTLRPDLSLSAGMVIVRTHWWIDGSLFQVALNMGLVGVVLFVALFARLFFVSLRAYLASGDDDESAILLGAIASLVFLVVSSFSMSCLTNYRFTNTWGVLMAVIVALSTKSKQAPRGTEAP
ncbi:O-antigen ligase family protein, partial [Candidatus Fermentibacterales bacterium]|nr:O-antigen ligase family protein [Candidatus Fermentibacterales bacterium]